MFVFIFLYLAYTFNAHAKPSHATTSHIAPFIDLVDTFYTLNTECLVFVVFEGVETPITASFPSRNGANKCVFPGVTTIVWIGICSGISKTGFSLFGQIQQIAEQIAKYQQIMKRKEEKRKQNANIKH